MTPITRKVYIIKSVDSSPPFTWLASLCI